jgi:hypothetical protein
VPLVGKPCYGMGLRPPGVEGLKRRESGGHRERPLRDARPNERCCEYLEPFLLTLECEEGELRK